MVALAISFEKPNGTTTTTTTTTTTITTTQTTINNQQFTIRIPIQYNSRFV